MSSDNDFSMKLWHAGCRIFLGVGDSLVYHFQCKSTGKVKKNNGGKQFLHKWGMRQSVFDHYYLRRGELAKSVALPEPEDTLRISLATVAQLAKAAPELRMLLFLLSWKAASISPDAPPLDSTANLSFNP